MNVCKHEVNMCVYIYVHRYVRICGLINWLILRNPFKGCHRRYHLKILVSQAAEIKLNFRNHSICGSHRYRTYCATTVLLSLVRRPGAHARHNLNLAALQGSYRTCCATTVLLSLLRRPGAHARHNLNLAALHGSYRTCCATTVLLFLLRRPGAHTRHNLNPAALQGNYCTCCVTTVLLFLVRRPGAHTRHNLNPVALQGSYRTYAVPRQSCYPS